MKKTLMTFIFMVIIGYGTEMMPLMSQPFFFMSFAHADDGGYKEIRDTKNHKMMPPSSKGHENANASAVAHHEAVQEAVENAGTERDAAQDIKVQALKDADNKDERKDAVDTAKEAVQDTQEKMQEEIKDADHDAVKNIEPKVKPSPKLVPIDQGVDLKKAGEEKRESESKLVASVTENAHKALRVVEEKISDADEPIAGVDETHESVEAMKNEVKGMRDDMVNLIKSEKDPDAVSHADEVKAVVEKARASIKEARIAMNDEIKNAADRAARLKAVEEFMSKVRTTIVGLREDLSGLVRV